MRSFVLACLTAAVVLVASNAMAQAYVTYMPVGPTPVVTYYSPYSPAPVASYGPVVSTSYYAPETVYYAAPTPYYAAPTPYYVASPVATPYYVASPYVAAPAYYGPSVIVRPKVYVRGEPVRNLIRAVTP
jgi:hypothetical protein